MNDLEMAVGDSAMTGSSTESFKARLPIKDCCSILRHYAPYEPEHHCQSFVHGR